MSKYWRVTCGQVKLQFSLVLVDKELIPWFGSFISGSPLITYAALK